jgi:hypothetical protein
LIDGGKLFPANLGFCVLTNAVLQTFNVVFAKLYWCLKDTICVEKLFQKLCDGLISKFT